MPRRASKQLIAQLEQLKLRFDPGSTKQIERLLKSLRTFIPPDTESFLRLHETLLFVRAYPQSRTVVRVSEALLRQFPTLVRNADDEVDLESLDHPETSGIAGRMVVDTFTYFTVSWLSRYFSRQVDFYWDWFEDENRLGQTWPRFMPLLEEDSFVEANVPYRKWLQAARNGEAELSWLIDRFQSLPLPEIDRAELYDSQQLYVQWRPPYRSSRTGMRLPARLAKSHIFCHRQPLISRRDISFADELRKPSPELDTLSNREGQAVLNLAREASTVRYRDLYGFTHGDPKYVRRAELGRGVELFVINLPPEKRLPLRAYHAALIFKNRVPVGYFEGLSLFERMESGFNLYYTFRDGETAWLYARTLNVMRHLLGVTTFSLDPYQIGFENEEGIESGAFWFYRKLRFRPTDAKLLKVTEAEEHKIRTRQSYRTTKTTLRKLAVSPMVFELLPANSGDWDKFQIRQIGMKAQRTLAESFGGEAQKMREAALSCAAELLRFEWRSFSETELRVVSNLSTVLLLLPDLKNWTLGERQNLGEIIQAKLESDERKYLRLMQRHEKFRRALIDVGS